MVQTYGLTHLNLAVHDMSRALRFYQQVFGLREYGRGDGLVHTQALGRHDILTFVQDAAGAGAAVRIGHFGFRLVWPARTAPCIRGGRGRRRTVPWWGGC